MPCGRNPPRRRRIEEAAPPRLVEKSPDAPDSAADCVATAEPTGDGTAVRVELDGTARRLSRAAAVELRDALQTALTERREFLYTAGVHREDGSYVVERRAADSAGHSKVFERFAALERLYDRLPGEFTAEKVACSGVTGGRRHLLVRHLAEHPAFDCELVSRQPLTARKRGDPPREGTDPPRERDDRSTDPVEVSATGD